MPRALPHVLLILFLLAGCGPAPQPEPTATALPSPTPPPPLDLTLRVTGEGGDPLSGAEVTLAGLQLQGITNAAGRLTLADVPKPRVTIHVAAQGYGSADEDLTLEPGSNEVNVAMQRVPFGVLREQACAPGETLLYLEDFQDGAVTNWGVYPPGSALKIQADPADAANKVLALDFGGRDGEFMLQAVPLQDSLVRRLKYKPGDHSRFHFNWGTGQEDYFVQLSADQFDLMAVRGGQVVSGLARTRPLMQQGVWHMLEASVVGESIEIWADGEQRLTYAGPPVTAGNVLGLGSAQLPPESIVLIDDISICTLGGPLTSPYAAPKP